MEHENEESPDVLQVEEDEFEVEEDDSENLEDTDLNSWLKDIAADVNDTLEFSDNGNRDNLMQNSQFTAFLLELCKLLPLWSGICCKYFEGSELFASSANVESYFKDVKLSHKGLLPCSVDLFLQANIDMTNGLISDASQNYIEYVADNAGTTGFDTTNDDIEDEGFSGFGEHELSSFETSSLVNNLVFLSEA